LYNPGHGGYDQDCSYSGTKEKDVVLAVSLKVEIFLLKMELMLCITKLVTILHGLTTNLLNLKCAAIFQMRKCYYFVSIHANSVDGSPSTSELKLYMET
jgi:N-acetylmuramoyl-L-alanine amidase